MYRKVLSLIIIIFATIFVVMFGHIHIISPEVQEITINSTPVAETLPANFNNNPTESNNFIKFRSEHVLDIASILQNPEYPTGCEITSVAMALRYITGTEVDIDILIDDYLPFSSVGNFVEGFTGNPRSRDGGGCYPPAIVKCINDYLNDMHMNVHAFDASGITLDDIKEYIDQGFPVLMWTTMNMREPRFINHTVTHNGRTFQWYVDEHCVLVIGYDEDRNVLIVNDPLEGSVERDMDAFMEISDFIGNFAVVVF